MNEIHTVSEPWLLLPVLKSVSVSFSGVSREEMLSNKAVSGFVKEIKGGRGEYLKSINQWGMPLYESVLRSSGKKYFLDKTPRYSVILPELLEAFPKAHFIFLIRNPLAVLGSMWNTWRKDTPFELYRHKEDLVDAPAKILQGIEDLGDQAIVLKYEDLVLSPEKEVKRICDYIGIEYDSRALEYDRHDWDFGDTDTIKKETVPNPKYIDEWVDSLSDPQFLRIVSEYLECLGKNVVNKMGYSYDNLFNQLRERHELLSESTRTYSLGTLIKNPGIYGEVEIFF